MTLNKAEGNISINIGTGSTSVQNLGTAIHVTNRDFSHISVGNIDLVRNGSFAFNPSGRAYSSTPSGTNYYVVNYSCDTSSPLIYSTSTRQFYDGTTGNSSVSMSFSSNSGITNNTNSRRASFDWASVNTWDELLEPWISDIVDAANDVLATQPIYTKDDTITTRSFSISVGFCPIIEMVGSGYTYSRIRFYIGTAPYSSGTMSRGINSTLSVSSDGIASLGMPSSGYNSGYSPGASTLFNSNGFTANYTALRCSTLYLVYSGTSTSLNSTYTLDSSYNEVQLN